MRSVLPCCLSAGKSVLGENMPGRFVGCKVYAKCRSRKKRKKLIKTRSQLRVEKKSRDERMECATPVRDQIVSDGPRC